MHAAENSMWLILPLIENDWTTYLKPKYYLDLSEKQADDTAGAEIPIIICICTHLTNYL